MYDVKELYEYQESTARHFRKAIRLSREKVTFNKLASKQIENIESYLSTYEIMFDTLVRVRESSSKIMSLQELSEIEVEIKSLSDSFWD